MLKSQTGLSAVPPWKRYSCIFVTCGMLAPCLDRGRDRASSFQRHVRQRTLRLARRFRRRRKGPAGTCPRPQSPTTTAKLLSSRPGRSRQLLGCRDAAHLRQATSTSAYHKHSLYLCIPNWRSAGSPTSEPTGDGAAIARTNPAAPAEKNATRPGCSWPQRSNAKTVGAMVAALRLSPS